MSVFRPTARVRAPDGTEWEIYAYRLQLQKRGLWAFGSGLSGPDPLSLSPAADVEIGLSLIDGLLWLLGLLPRSLVLILWDVPRAGIEALRSGRWTIEAVSWYPHRTSYMWTTSREHHAAVLEQVQSQLARGERPRPENALSLGVEG